MSTPVECELARIIISETSPNQIIVLREKGGERLFQIVIGVIEAMAIHREIKGERLPRPLTHDLLNHVIREMGGKLERIVVNDLREGTFFARLLIRRDSELIDVDARPSDAVALAVRCGAPIFVEERVFEAVLQPDAELLEGGGALDEAEADASEEPPEELPEELPDAPPGLPPPPPPPPKKPPKPPPKKKP